MTRFGSLRRWVPGPIDSLVERVTSSDDETDTDRGRLERWGLYLIREYGYIGLFVPLTIPAFPHKTMVYMTSILDDSYSQFTMAVFGGAVGRLSVYLALGSGVLALF